MSTTRRTFLSHLAAAFGAATIPDLRARIEDRGKPILLTAPQPQQSLYVYEDGLITLGSLEDYDDDYRPTWRELLQAEGVQIHDTAELLREVNDRSMDPEELDQRISDVCWPMAEALTWNPTARAHRMLKKWKVGASWRGRDGRAGKLSFHEGDNHPGSNDFWVNVEDDLSVSLLQARLIELRVPAQVIMSCPTVQRELLY